MSMKDYKYSESIHERFKAIRAALGQTQAGMDEILGYTGAYYNKLENERFPVRKYIVLAICNEFNIRFEYLADGNGPMFDEPSAAEAELRDLFRNLSMEDRETMIKFARFLNGDKFNRK